MKQIAEFKKLYRQIEKAGFSPIYRHIAASSGILKIQDPFFSAIRPGIILYGYNPLTPIDPYFQKGIDLLPALDLYSTITAIQYIAPLEGIGYNLTDSIDRSRTIASVPC
jgi:alanine racemase